MLFHLGYVSTQTVPMQGEDLVALLEKARTANQARDITGILLHREDSFFQVLEGNEEVVRETFDRILEDDRHCRVKVLFQEPIEAREFSDWRMGFLQLDDVDVSQLPGFFDFLAEPAAPRVLFEKLSRASRLALLFRAMT